MRRRWLYAALAGLFALGFTWLNRGETMVLHLGFVTWYRAPVAPVLLAAFLMGMVALVLLGLLRRPPDRPDF